MGKIKETKMSGRGRGRGRGFAQPTGGRMFLMRSADECGLDSRNLRSLVDITRPPLFPDILLHSSHDQSLLNTEQEILTVKDEAGMAPSQSVQASTTRSSQQTLYLISKGREINHRLQSSAFYVRPTKDIPDIIRYSDSKRPRQQIDAGDVLSHCLGGRTRTEAGIFVPEELLSGRKRVQIDSGALDKSSNMNELEAIERLRKGSMDEDGDLDGTAVVEDEGEEDDGADYVTNHYDSDGDASDGGGDEEPTY